MTGRREEHPYWREIWLVGLTVLAVIIYCYGTGIWTRNVFDIAIGR